MFADDDLVTMQEVMDMYAAIPNAELAAVPTPPTFLTQEKPDLVNRIVLDFLTLEPVPDRRPDPPRLRTAGLTHRHRHRGADAPVPRIGPLALRR